MEQTEKVRLGADNIYANIKEMFSRPNDENFGKFFQNLVDEFRAATKDMPNENVFQLVVDPTV